MFLNPLLLFGLSAVAVPIVIHLLNRRKHKRVAWAAMRFVEQALRKNRKRMSIEDLLLLVLRCLILAFLAIAMARPALRGAMGWLGQSQVTAVILLDNSYSMSQTDGAISRFEQAQKSVAEQAIQTLPAGASAGFLLASDIVQEVIPEPTHDLNLVRQRIAQAQLCDRGSNLLPAIQRAVRILQAKAGVRKEIYVITDGQALAWRQGSQIQQLLDEVKQEINTHVVFVGGQGKQNVGITRLSLATSPAPINEALRLEVGVTNCGIAAVQDLPVRLSLDGEPPSEQVTIPVLKPGESRSVALFVRVAKEGMHTVTATIPHDQLPRDDARSILAHVINKVQVLLVDGKPGKELRDNETSYLQGALQPVEPLLRDQYFIQTKVISPAELETARLDEYDLIVMANVPDVPKGVVQSLDRVVRDGRGLIILPGDQTNAGSYNEQMLQAFSLMPATLGDIAGDAGQQEQFWTYQAKGFDHPVVAMWNDSAAGNMASVRTYRRYELTPANATTKTKDQLQVGEDQISTILQYNDGKPAIIERSHGMGNVVLFAGPVSTNAGWNDLAVRPKVFIPLLHRLVGALLAQQEGRMNLRVGQKLVWRVGEELLGRDLMIARPGETRVVDSQKVELVNGYPMVQYAQTDLAGIYSATLSGETTPILRFAVQSDPEESRLEVVPKEQVDALSTVASVVEWSPGIPLQDKLRSGRTGTEIWFPIAVLAAAAAAMETYMAFRFSQVK